MRLWTEDGADEGVPTQDARMQALVKSHVFAMVMVVTVVLPLTMVDWVALVTPLFCVVTSLLVLLLSTLDGGLLSMGAASASDGPPRSHGVKPSRHRASQCGPWSASGEAWKVDDSLLAVASDMAELYDLRVA